jgi:hypothetical protein
MYKIQILKMYYNYKLKKNMINYKGGQNSEISLKTSLNNFKCILLLETCSPHKF